MAERANTMFRGGSRFYVNQLTREKLPGVTSVLNMLPKPFLGPWQAKLTAEYAVERMAELFPIALKDPAAAVELIKGAPRRYTKERADVGTFAHEMFEKMAKGEKLRNVPSDMALYRTAFDEFLNRFQPTFVDQEFTVWDSTVGYAGSADAVMIVEGEQIVVDYKTSKSIHEETALQLAAYRHAANIMVDGGELVPNHETVGGAVFHVAHDGSWSFIPAACGREQMDVFEHLLAVFHWDAGGKRGVLGKAL